MSKEATESSRDPQQKHLVIDGPLRGTHFAYPGDHFYVGQINVTSETPPGEARVCYFLRSGDDGGLVWSCEVP